MFMCGTSALSHPVMTRLDRAAHRRTALVKVARTSRAMTGWV
jgi:hypothetical protein